MIDCVTRNLIPKACKWVQFSLFGLRQAGGESDKKASQNVSKLAARIKWVMVGAYICTCPQCFRWLVHSFSQSLDCWYAKRRVQVLKEERRTDGHLMANICDQDDDNNNDLQKRETKPTWPSRRFEFELGTSGLVSLDGAVGLLKYIHIYLYIC